MGDLMISPDLDDHEPLSDINVTPFVDVLLVLLVIFMITAPIINQVVQVELPKDSYTKDGASVDKSLKIIIDPTGTIFINNDVIGIGLDGENEKKFLKTVQEWAGTRRLPVFVDVEADKNAKWDDIIPVITRLKEVNVGINFVIDPAHKP